MARYLLWYDDNDVKNGLVKPDGTINPEMIGSK